MILGIEGTGSQGWGNDDLMRTFVRRVLHQTTLRPASYFIGPNDRGSDGLTIATAAKHAVESGRHNKPVVMLGYSRGAAYCMWIAEQLQASGVTIDLLFMFDSVARQREFTIPDKVPSNVKVCYHAIRDPRAGSRYFFQNVGLTAENPRATRFTKKYFFGSHGALGGVSWDAAKDEYGGTVGNATFTVDDRQHLNIPSQPVTNRAQDDACANDVALWAWDILERERIVPSAKNALNTAPAFSGSQKPGVRNMVK